MNGPILIRVQAAGALTACKDSDPQAQRDLNWNGRLLSEAPGSALILGLSSLRTGS